MNITYNEPKYKLGDEFTSDVGRGKLTRVDHDKIAMVIIDGSSDGHTCTWGKTVDDMSKLTESEVEQTFGSDVNFKQVNPREPNITLEVTEDELKVLWGRLNPASNTLGDQLESYGTLEIDKEIKHGMWLNVHKACKTIGLDASYDGFKE